MLHFSKKISVSFAIASALLIAVMPSTASAGSVHIQLPHFSLGYSDHHRYSRRHDGEHRGHYKSRHYRNKYYSRYNRHGYSKSYRNDYRNGYRNNYGGYRSYRNAVCPDAGYSPYYNDNLNCYRHKDHFHCK